MKCLLEPRCIIFFPFTPVEVAGKSEQPCKEDDAVKDVVFYWVADRMKLLRRVQDEKETIGNEVRGKLEWVEDAVTMTGCR